MLSRDKLKRATETIGLDKTSIFCEEQTAMTIEPSSILLSGNDQAATDARNILQQTQAQTTTVRTEQAAVARITH